MRHVLSGAVFLLVLITSAWGQAPLPQVQPIPISGGDVLPPIGIFNQFFPGEGAGFDGLNAEPHGFTNFHGTVAMGYTLGVATDNTGKAYQVITDIRVYRGEYVGGVSTFGGGGTSSAKAFGTFVEI